MRGTVHITTSKLGSISNNQDKLKNYDFVIYAGSLGKFFRYDNKIET